MDGFFNKLRAGLAKTSGGMLRAIFAGDERINAAFYEELEEALIVADVGMGAAEDILDMLRAIIGENKLKTRDEARAQLKSILADMMRPESAFKADSGPAVLLIVGVNGVGKTTTVGKLANYYKQLGRKPMIAAADTFRAAAAEQLSVWAERADAPVVKHGEGADPAAVLFDAIASYKAKGCDILLCDTAGRLHNKQNLMNELSKLRRVIARELPDTPTEVLLVIDATTGQNAIAQARAFSQSAGLTGVIVTKLDGTAKGGSCVAVGRELSLPVRFVGVGEGADDLLPFDADSFAAALTE